MAPPQQCSRVAQPQPKAAPYDLPRGHRRRRHEAEPEELSSAMREAEASPAPAAAPGGPHPQTRDEIHSRTQAKTKRNDLTPAEMQRLVKGVRWEKESQEEYLARSLPSSTSTTATLGPEITVFGRVECEGHVDLYGMVEGEIFCDSVSIAAGGKVLGSIVAQQVWVGGTIDGPITAHSVTLAKSAEVNGSIFHRELHMEPGAKHKGRKPWRLNPLENR